MPEPSDVRTERAQQRRGAIALRAAGYVVALALGAIGLWMVVAGDTPQRVQLGVLLGLWGLLLGAFAVFGTRRAQSAVAGADAADAAVALPAQRDPDRAADPSAADRPDASTELAVRRALALERDQDMAARRDFEVRLLHLMRSEIRTTVSGELSMLRSELTALRGELLDNVGGQLRLERIETTRVIGSDIEALQREIDQLKSVRTRSEQAYAQTRPAEPARTIDATLVTNFVHQAVDARPGTPAAQAVPSAEPAAPGGAAPAPAQAAADRVGEHAPEQPSTPAPVPDEPVLAADPFAGLPRLRPFTDLPLPGESRPSAGAPGGLGHSSVQRSSAPLGAGGDPEYRGRRRRDAGDHLAAAHRGARTDAPAPAEGGGRRRRADGDGNDVLDRILAREGGRD